MRGVDHGEEGLRLANQTLRLYPYDRVLRPVMNSLRKDVELNPFTDRFGGKQSARPLPINQRPHDNEYEWKGNPYRLDGWLKPTVAAVAFSCDDPQAAWLADSAGRFFRTLDGGASWQDASSALMGAHVQNLVASGTRTFVVWAQTDKGTLVTRDGGLSWRAAGDDAPTFVTPNFADWLKLSNSIWLRVSAEGQLQRSTNGGASAEPVMQGWRIPRAQAVFKTPWGIAASGPGGTYRSADGEMWTELKIWREDETGAADFLHAYWMGRYYGFVPPDSVNK